MELERLRPGASRRSRLLAGAFPVILVSDTVVHLLPNIITKFIYLHAYMKYTEINYWMI